MTPGTVKSLGLTRGAVAPIGFQLTVVLGATAAAIALGAVYAFSPMLVWCSLAAAGIVAWAITDLPPRERQAVLWILGIAIGLRVLAIAGLFLFTDHDHLANFFFEGDGLYLKRRSLLIRNVWLGIPIATYDYPGAFDPHYGWTGYVFVLAYLQYLIGPAPYGVHLMNTVLFVAGAVALYRVLRNVYGSPAALGGLTTVLFLPSLFFWSVSALKESMQFCLAAVTMAAAITVARVSAWPRRLAAAAVSMAALAGLSTMRTGSMLMGLFALLLAVAGQAITRRLSVAVVALALLSVVGVRVLSRPDIQEQIIGQLEFAAMVQVGNVNTTGHGYKVLDQRFYSGDKVITMTGAEALRFVARAGASFILVPLPWDLASASELLFLPEQIAWYALVALALVGCVVGLRQDAFATCLLIGYILAGSAVVAVSSGNVGSMIRHRGIVLPFVVWLSAVGAVQLLVGLTARFRAAGHLPGCDSAATSAT